MSPGVSIGLRVLALAEQPFEPDTDNSDEGSEEPCRKLLGKR